MSLDEQQFKTLAADNLARIHRIASSYTFGQDSQDLVQEILLQLWRSRQGFRQESDPATWLYRVALNTAISHRRKRALATTSSVDIDKPGAIGNPVDQSWLLEQFLDQLNDVDRSTMLLFLEGLDRHQIAEVIGSTPAAIAVRLTRLKQRFESIFIEEAK